MIRLAGLLALSAAASLSWTAAWATVPRTAVDHALDAVFRTIDHDGNGVIGSGEVDRFADHLFAAMDRDHDGQVTRFEFKGITFGLRPLAERHGRTRFETAARDRLFGRGKEHGQGFMSLGSLRRGLRTELSRAAGYGRITRDRFKRAQFVEDFAVALHR